MNNIHKARADPEKSESEPLSKREFPDKNAQVLKLRFVDWKKVNDPLKLQHFVEWFARPKKIKCAETQGQFAKKIGVSPDTLTAWKNLAGFWEDVEVARKAFWGEHMSDIYYGMIHRAKLGYEQDVNNINQWLGTYAAEMAFIIRELRSLRYEERAYLLEGIRQVRKRLARNRKRNRKRR